MFPARIFYPFSWASHIMELLVTSCSLPSSLILAALFCGQVAIGLWRYGGCYLLCWSDVLSLPCVYPSCLGTCFKLKDVLFTWVPTLVGMQPWQILSSCFPSLLSPCLLTCTWEWRCVSQVPDVGDRWTCRTWHTTWLWVLVISIDKAIQNIAGKPEAKFIV